MSNSSLWFFLAISFMHIAGFAKAFHLNSDETSLEMEEFPPPWFTGPILTPSGHVVPAGYVNFEPYTFVTIIDAEYDNHWHAVKIPTFYNVNFQAPLYIGLTDWMDMQIIPAASWNETEHVTSLEFNDFTLAFDFRIMEDTATNNIPGIKVYVQETFPTGHYQRRSFEKKGTDIGGAGAFVTTLGFVITRTFHIYGLHFLAVRFNGFYDIPIPSRVHVHGINTYGGARNTNAKVKVGQSWGLLYGMEYSLTQNWALAIDLSATGDFRTTFSGNPGTNPDGTRASLGNPPAFQFSLAPAIEYNFNESVGIIAGAWFTVAGRNNTKFISAVIAINYYGPEKDEPTNKYQSSGGGGK